MAVRLDQVAGLMADDQSLVFRTRALAQAHPLSVGASRYLNRVVARERSTQPQAEIGIWAGNGLMVGYCLRRIEEVEAGEEPLESAIMEFDAADGAATDIAESIRTSSPEDVYLLDEETVVTTLDEIIAGEIERRLDHWKGTVTAETWRELEEYIAWWVIKGYALRVAETR